MKPFCVYHQRKMHGVGSSPIEAEGLECDDCRNWAEVGPEMLQLLKEALSYIGNDLKHGHVTERNRGFVNRMDSIISRASRIKGK